MNVPFRYRKLGYAALTVTDLTRSVHFYRDLLGLELVEQHDDTAFLRCSRDHHNLLLHQGPLAGLKRIGWELESQADTEKAFAHFESLGLAPRRVGRAEAQSLRQGPGFRVRLPGAGLEFDYYGSTTVMARAWTPTV
ncbi:MAG: VOC family protein, partial [Burkholderiaceae bacterium]|nr:VOC family protein [Burkholderiaceae bacterium]